MEDHFLYKLRNGQLQNNKSNYRSKKNLDNKKDVTALSDSQKQLEKLLEKLLVFQKNALICLEKITDFQNKQSKTMTKMFSTLKSMEELAKLQHKKKNAYHNQDTPEPEQITNNKEEIKEKGLAPPDEKALFKSILKMRKNNQTWNSIATFLKKERIPTLTGNGTWSPNLALYFYKKMLP